MGEAKRKAEAERLKKEQGIETVTVVVIGDISKEGVSNMRVGSEQTSNCLVMTSMLAQAIQMTLNAHMQQLLKAGQSRIAEPTMQDIALAKGGRLPP